MEAAPFTLKVNKLKPEVMETLRYGCVAGTLSKEHFAELRRAHHRFLRKTGFKRRQRTDQLMSQTKALKKTQCETIRKRLSSLLGAYSGRTISD